MFFSQKEKKEKKPTVGIFGMVSLGFIHCLKLLCHKRDIPHGIRLSYEVELEVTLTEDLAYFQKNGKHSLSWTEPQ